MNTPPFVPFVRRHRRRISLTAVMSLSATGMFLGNFDAIAAVLKPNFVARDGTRYSENPNLSGYGLKDITVAYEGSLWPAGASKTQPDTTYIANNYIPKIRSKNPDVVVIDIEVWKFNSSMTSTEITANINKFKKVIAVFRRDLPKTKIGVYLHLPERNWLAPCGDPNKVASRTSAWHARNLKLQPLADAVDIIVPSLYTFYDDAASIRLLANLGEGQHQGGQDLWKACLGVPVDEVSLQWQVDPAHILAHATRDNVLGRGWRRDLEQGRDRQVELDCAMVG